MPSKYSVVLIDESKGYPEIVKYLNPNDFATMMPKEQVQSAEDQEELAYIKHFCITRTLTFLFALITTIVIYIIYAMNKDRNVIALMDDRPMINNPLVQEIDRAYGYIVYQGQHIEYGTTSQGILKYRKQMTYLLMMTLADRLRWLEEDVTTKYGYCESICDEFDVLHNSSILYRTTKETPLTPDPDRMSDMMIEIREPMKEVIIYMVKKVHDKPEFMEEVRKLWRDKSILKPVRDVFLFKSWEMQ